MRKRFLMDMTHDSTLAWAIFTAFHDAAPKYGARLVGIEDEANEHMDFFLQVARSLLVANTAPLEAPNAD